MKTPAITYVEVWHEIEWSYRGVDDWFTTGEKFDILDNARKAMASKTAEAFEYRLTRKTVTTEVL